MTCAAMTARIEPEFGILAEYLHVQMAATHWTECIVLAVTADRYVVLFYDHHVEDYLVYRVAKDRVRWPQSGMA